MGKEELLASAPWRGEETSNKFEDAKLRATNHPGATPTMHVPRKNKSVSSRTNDDDDDFEAEIDPCSDTASRGTSSFSNEFSVSTPL